jgi:hypothetical protein
MKFLIRHGALSMSQYCFSLPVLIFDLSPGSWPSCRGTTSKFRACIHRRAMPSFKGWNRCINLHPPAVTNAIKEIIAKEGGRHNSPVVIAKARDRVANSRPSKKPYLSPTFGYVAQWLSEVAGSPDLDALLLHADTYINPSWSKGGLYYARCDTGWNKDGNYTYVEPYTENAAIGYARLNVKDGQKKMWDRPWTKEEVDNRPWIDGVGLEQDVDCLQGTWDETSSCDCNFQDLERAA